MSPPESLLIYRLGSLGDTVVALPCFHLIRKTCPHTRIFILTNQPVSGKAAPAMDILANSGLCDEAISYPVGTRSLSELAKVRRTIRQIRPGIVVNLAAARGRLKSLRDYYFFRSCGVKKIIGTPLRRRDFEVQPASQGLFEPESQRLASRLSALGTVDLADQSFWKLELAPDEKKQAGELLPKNQNNFIGVSVGTKVLANDWGEENWGRLLALLSKAMPEAVLVLLGAADEWDRSEKLSRVWAGSCVNLCGKTSPRISAAILEHCRLFIGHDSGPLHLAGAVGIPSLGLFSWNNPPGQWFPGHRSWKFIKILYPELPAGGWNAGLRMKHGVGEGIQKLQPDEVFAAALELWHRQNEEVGK
jgi:ADP-heptose:LPS heptosyltransferase